MKKRLTRNLGLKIVSLFFAVALWLIVVNMNDPVITRRFANIPVTFVNTTAVTGEGKVYEVLDGTDTISTVAITGQRSIVENILASDIVATADFENGMNPDGTVDINLSCSRYNSRISSIRGNVDAVKLHIEDKKTAQLVLKATTTGEAAPGCLVGNITTDQNLVRIEGPESVVSMVSRAAVNVDVSGAASTIATYASIVLYDAENNEVSTPSLTKNVDQVRVSVEILNTKEIPVLFTVSGTPANGYLSTGIIAVEPASVMICGTTNNLAKLDSIVVPESELNIAGKMEDMTVSIDLDSYLPGGISWADNEFDGKVTVTVGIEKAVTRSLSIAKNTLVAVNVPEGFTASVSVGNDEEERYTVQITGLSEDVEAVEEADVIGYVDINEFMADQGLSGAGELQPGVYNVSLLVNNIGETKLAAPVRALLTIEAEGAEEEQE